MSNTGGTTGGLVDDDGKISANVFHTRSLVFDCREGLGVLCFRGSKGLSLNQDKGRARSAACSFKTGGI